MGAKKGRLGWMPKDWEAKILEAARHNAVNHKATYAEGLAVLWATGCRPSELAKGVQIRKNGLNWEFTITGTKTAPTGGVAGSASRGSALRVVKVKASDVPWSKCLDDAYKKNGGGWLIVKTSSSATIGEQMRRLATREWPDLPANRLPSPYSFRHLIARDLKTQKESRETIAKVLGHASCQSQGKYGRWRKGGGNGLKRVIEAVSSVKPRAIKPEVAQGSLNRFKAASRAKTVAKTKNLSRSRPSM